MLVCPKCGYNFSYGYPCVYELMLRLLWLGKWKCSNCGVVIISDCQIIQLDDEQMKALAEEYKNDATL